MTIRKALNTSIRRLATKRDRLFQQDPRSIRGRQLAGLTNELKRLALNLPVRVPSLLHILDLGNRTTESTQAPAEEAFTSNER